MHIGNDIYLDGVNLSKTEFYEKLRTEKSFPTTAQPTPHTFEEVFTAALKEADEVVCLLISLELSGTVQSANIAKNTMERDEIHILDSRTTCLSLGLLVEIAAQRAKEGKTAAEIMTELEGLTSRVRICAGIETLEYLKKGGRLSGTAAALGTMLNIRPLMGILDGKVLMLGKARGNKKMYAQLKQMVEEEGIDDAYPVLLGHAQSMENYEKFKEACGDLIAVSYTHLDVYKRQVSVTVIIFSMVPPMPRKITQRPVAFMMVSCILTFMALPKRAPRRPPNNMPPTLMSVPNPIICIFLPKMRFFFCDELVLF